MLLPFSCINMEDIMVKTKLIAMYLPQFHEIPENSMFWGDGFTDWVTVKNAKPLFDGHYEPRKPMDGIYYDLSSKQAIAKQIAQANEAGIYGFCMYHYWFSTQKNILETPSEIILQNKDMNINFCFAWDNASWIRSWSNVPGNDWAPVAENNAAKDLSVAKTGVLIKYELGNEDDWKAHYDYLKKFFLDSRYIKTNSKPVFIIWNYSEQIKRMEEYWNNLAIQDGFAGIEFIHKYKTKPQLPVGLKSFFYEPAHSSWEMLSYRVKNKILNYMSDKRIKKYDYDKVWKSNIANAKKNKDTDVYFGAFVDYDDTPRRGINGQLMVGAAPLKFEKYLKQLIDINEQRNNPYIFLTAWNEWGEGAYLEPDTVNKDEYLQAIKKIFGGNGK